jgi:hypothetical protein
MTLRCRYSTLRFCVPRWRWTSSLVSKGWRTFEPFSERRFAPTHQAQVLANCPARRDFMSGIDVPEGI